MMQVLFSFVLAALSVQQAISHTHQVEKRSNQAQFNNDDFQKAGLSSGILDRFVEIASREAAHIEILTEALGNQATQPCQYPFPYNDVLSSAVASITTPELLTVAASILSTEARHASWVASAVNQLTPWFGPFETPLPPPVVVELAVEFITSCPSISPPLNLTTLPTLTLPNAVPGQKVTVQLGSAVTNPEFIVFFSGLSVTFVLIDDNGQITVPANVSGLAYAVASTSGTEVTAQTIVAGPAILSFANNVS